MTDEKEPERIRLGRDAIEILKRRCDAAEHAEPRRYVCLTCLDEGLVYVRVVTGRYPFFGVLRCTCDGRERGYFIPHTNKPDDKSRTLGNRTWEEKIPRYTEKGIPKDQVYSIQARLDYERQEEEYRAAASTPEAIEECKAIQGEP